MRGRKTCKSGLSQGTPNIKGAQESGSPGGSSLPSGGCSEVDSTGVLQEAEHCLESSPSSPPVSPLPLLQHKPCH